MGVTLSDSPAGLAAYILEKFSPWTRREHRSAPDGGLTFHFSKEQLIDSLMMYWVPNAITTSARFYAENMGKRFMGLQIDEIHTYVPTWVIQTKHDLDRSPEPAWLVRTKFQNLLHETAVDDGGHFLTVEMPKGFSEDLLKAITAFRNWHK